MGEELIVKSRTTQSGHAIRSDLQGKKSKPLTQPQLLCFSENEISLQTKRWELNEEKSNRPVGPPLGAAAAAAAASVWGRLRRSEH